MGQDIPPYSDYLCRAPDIVAVITILNVFSYDAVSGRDSNLHLSDDERMRYMLYTLIFIIETIIPFFSNIFHLVENMDIRPFSISDRIPDIRLISNAGYLVICRISGHF